MDLNDLTTRVRLDRRAVAYSLDVVNQARESDLDRRTPCSDWNLRQLLGHMIAHHEGWTAALTGAPVGGEVWDRTDFGPHTGAEFHAAYEAAATAVNAAFGQAGLPDKAEVYGFGTLGINTVLGMHIVDYVVHGWDVAKAIGSPTRPDDELAEAAYAIMRQFPVGKRPSVAFDVMVEPAPDASAMDRLVAYVGRDPDWPVENSAGTRVPD